MSCSCRYDTGVVNCKLPLRADREQNACNVVVTSVSAIVHHAVVRPISYLARKVCQLAGIVAAGVSTAVVSVAHAIIAHIPLPWLIRMSSALSRIGKTVVLTGIVLGLGWLWAYGPMLLLTIAVGLAVALWTWWRCRSTIEPAATPTPTSKPKAPQGNHRAAAFATH